MKSLRCVKVLNNIFNQCVSIMISLWIYIEYHMILYSGKFLAVTTSSNKRLHYVKKNKEKNGFACNVQTSYNEARDSSVLALLELYLMELWRSN